MMQIKSVWLREEFVAWLILQNKSNLHVTLCGVCPVK